MHPHRDGLNAGSVRLIRRFTLALAALFALVGTVQVLRYVFWRRAIVAQVSTDSRVQATTRGAIEYIRLGDSSGVPVLWLHGNPGGYDQLARTLVTGDRSVDALSSIVVSRPGYLRTPLENGPTPVEQAHLFAQLLDSLHIQRVAVVGVGGGAVSALQFARIFPKRTIALVLAFAITKRYTPLIVGRRQRLADALGAGDWLTWRRAQHLEWISGFDATDTAMVRIAKARLASTVPRVARRAGDVNDALQFDRPDGWPIDGITAPTLILAGTEDTMVPIAHAGFAKEMIPGSRLLLIEGDHDAATTRAGEVGRAISGFVLSFARPHPRR